MRPQKNPNLNKSDTEDALQHLAHPGQEQKRIERYSRGPQDDPSTKIPDGNKATNQLY